MKSGGTSNSVAEFKPPEYTVQPWKDYLSGAQTLSQQPLNPYMGQTVAPLTPMTGTGLQGLSDFAIYGSPERQAGGGALVGAATGDASNEFIGQNPYLMSMIDASNAKITDQYKKAIQSPNDAMMARAGAYGGSEWQDRTASNERDLAGAIGQNTNSLLNQNYTQSAALREADLNRRLQAAGTGVAQQGADLSSMLAMIAGGQIPEENYNKLLAANKSIYDQQQQAPFTLSDFLGSALGRASGSGGEKTQTNSGGGNSWLANAAGLGLLGIGLS